MKITDVRSMRLVGPRPHGVGGTPTEASKIVVRIDTDAGIFGLGEVDDFMGVREGLRYYKAWLMGRSPFDINPFFSEMLYGTLPPHPESRKIPAHHFAGTYRAVLGCSPTATPTGPVVWALSGVEMALCDLVGKALKTPVYNLLGGKFRQWIQIYLDRSAPQNAEDLDSWRDLAAGSLAEGFSFLKFDIDHMAPELTPDPWRRSLSSAQIHRIVERVNAVRKVVGPEVELCVDCHMQYNVPDAVRLAEALAPFQLFWLEDPTPITNPDACAEVRKKSRIPICVGEMFIAEQCRLFIDHQACDILHPDVLFCGGLHEMRRIADYAELHYLPLAMHGNGGCLATIAAAHAAAATRNFLGLEYHFIEAAWMGAYVRREGVPLFRDGALPLTDAPGLGVELDEEVCMRHLGPGEVMF